MNTTLSMTSDIIGGHGDAEKALRFIAEAGYTQIHWCHRWTGLYAYPLERVAEIALQLKRHGLSLVDLHATDGGPREGYCWISQDDWEWRLGISLIENRIAMTSMLGGRAIVLHAPPPHLAAGPEFWELMEENLELMTQMAERYQVRIALENVPDPAPNVPVIRRMLQMSDPAWIGVCYDSGHGRLVEDQGDYGLDFLEEVVRQGRLFALHLHDNHGPIPDASEGDIHMLPFDVRITNGVDWQRFAKILAGSSYDGPLTFEVGMSQYRDTPVPEYLVQAFYAGLKLVAMVTEERQG